MSVGQPTPRVEGPLKVTGAAKYAADNSPAGLLHAVLIGSPKAAGRLLAVDTTRAAAVPGVVRVMTQADMPKFAKLGMPAAITHMPLTTDAILWEGQPVAIVLAETIEAAEEAAALVGVTIAETTPVVPSKGRLERPPGEQLFEIRETKGDVAQGIAGSDVSLTQSWFQPTRNHNPMETSATVAEWENDKLTLWDAQFPKYCALD